MSEQRSAETNLDQRFEARVAHLVGMAESWGRKGGPSTPELDQAIRELREYFYQRTAVDAAPPHEHEWTDHAYCLVCGVKYDSLPDETSAAPEIETGPIDDVYVEGLKWLDENG